jgi:GDPmannose 4,6-dehydratase
MKSAVITGITGQDGAYLTQLLLEKGYKVYGVIRRNSVCSSQSVRIEHIRDKITVIYGDITDTASLINAIQKSAPDEIYNLAAQSHVGVSFEIPEYTANVDGIGALRILETIRQNQSKKKIKYN